MDLERIAKSRFEMESYHVMLRNLVIPHQG